MARWTRTTHEHADRKYECRVVAGKVIHDKACRPGRPLCKHRRAPCRCSALPFPHRKGSVRGCREGGIPENLVREGYLESREGGYPSSWDETAAERRRRFTHTRSTRGRWG